MDFASLIKIKELKGLPYFVAFGLISLLETFVLHYLMMEIRVYPYVFFLVFIGYYVLRQHIPGFAPMSLIAMPILGGFGLLFSLPTICVLFILAGYSNYKTWRRAYSFKAA